MKMHAVQNQILYSTVFNGREESLKLPLDVSPKPVYSVDITKREQHFMREKH